MADAAGSSSGLSSSAAPPSQSSKEEDMSDVSRVRKATKENLDFLVSNTMKNLSIRPPIGQTPLFQEEAIKKLDNQTIGEFFKEVQNEYNQAKIRKFWIDWSVPFQRQTQMILFYFWSRRFAIAYAEFYADNKEEYSNIDGYDFSTASSRLRAARSFYAQQVATWDALVSNDAGKWLDRILIGSQATGDEAMAAKVEHYITGIIQEQLDEVSVAPGYAEAGAGDARLREVANALQEQLQQATRRFQASYAGRIGYSVNNMDLTPLMSPDKSVEEMMTAYEPAKQGQRDLQRLKSAAIERSIYNIDLKPLMSPDQSVSKLEEDLEKAESALRELSETLASDQTQMTSTMTELNEAQEKYKSALRRLIKNSVNDVDLNLLDQAYQQVREQEEKVKKLSEQLEKLKETLTTDKDTLSGQVSEANRELEKKKKELEQMLAERIKGSVNDFGLNLLDQAYQQVREQEEKVRELDQQLAALKSSVTTDKEKLSSDLSEANRELEETKKKLGRLLAERIKGSVNDFPLDLFMARNELIDRLERNKEDLVREKQQLEQSLTSKNQEEVERLSDIIKQKDEQIRRLKAKNEQQVKDIRKETKSWKSEKEELEKQKKKAMERAIDAEKAKKEAETAVEKAKKGAEKAKKDAEKEVEKAKKDVEKAKKEAEKEVEKAKKEAETAAEKARKDAEKVMKETTEAAEKAKSDAEAAIKAIQSVFDKEKRQRIRASIMDLPILFTGPVEVETLRKEIKGLTSELSASQLNVSNLSAQLTAAQSKIRELEKSKELTEKEKQELVRLKNERDILLNIAREVYRQIPRDNFEPREFLDNLKDDNKRSNELKLLYSRIQSMKDIQNDEARVVRRLLELRNKKTDLGIGTGDRPGEILDKLIRGAEECTLNKSLKTQNDELKRQVASKHTEVERLQNTLSLTQGDRDRYSGRVAELEGAQSTQNDVIVRLVSQNENKVGQLDENLTPLQKLELILQQLGTRTSQDLPPGELQRLQDQDLKLDTLINRWGTRLGLETSDATKSNKLGAILERLAERVRRANMFKKDRLRNSLMPEAVSEILLTRYGNVSTLSLFGNRF